VSMAMAKLKEEFSSQPPLAVAPDDHSPEAEMFRRVVVDPFRAARLSRIVVLACRTEGTGGGHPG